MPRPTFDGLGVSTSPRETAQMEPSQTTAQSAAPIAAPIAAKQPFKHVAHGTERSDDYRWLQDRNDPAVIEYLLEENRYADALLAETIAERDAIFGEIESRVLPVADSAPVRKGPWEYFERSFSDQPYVKHLRRPWGPGIRSAVEEVVLDENALAVGHDFFEVGSYEISPDHRLLAYALDTNGGEVYELRIRNLETSEDLADEIPNLYYGVAWSKDSRSIFYTRPDEAVRPYQVWRHQIGTPSTEDKLIFEEPDESFFVSVYESRSGDYILIGTGSRITSDVRYIPSDTPEAAPRLVAQRRHGIEYEVDHLRAANSASVERTDGEPANDQWAILTNDNALDFRVATAAIGDSEPERWRDLAPHRMGTRIAEMDVFEKHVVVSERRDGLEHLRVIRVADGNEQSIQMPDPVYTVATGANPEYSSETLRYSYASPTQPPRDLDYNFESGSTSIVKETEIPGFNKDQYICERSWASADDGTQIPISIVYKKTTPLDGTAPCLLYGYGSYEICIEPSFSSARLSLLDRGFVYAIAHIRGGGEMGRSWYEQGRLLQKRNTFTDFISCAEYLCSENYTSAMRLGARGRSAGGLLMGAVSNLAPHAFRAISAEVPFVDCVSTMSDPALPLTVGEWEEWGNPIESRADYEYMLSYSPYDNVENHPYPAMFVAAGLNDPRVMYWEPAKWVAKHRALRSDTNLLILRTEMGSGHGGPSGRQDAWREEAAVLAFFVHALS